MSETEPNRRRHRILIVDDDADIRKTLSEWFRRDPFEVRVADGGARGVQLALEQIPDLVLLDLRMPGMDGIEVVRRLRAEDRTRNVPVLLLTAVSDTEAKMEAFNSGADDYMPKSMELEEVEVRVRTALRRRDATRELESNVAHLSNQNQQLEELLMIDEKTGLYNFREFRRRLRDEWERAQRYETSLSLVMFDLDHFKRINDTLGHPAGDRALREFAMLVAGGARASDIAARYGGEEFAIILPHTGSDEAAQVAERTRSAVAEFLFLADESPTRVTVSAGVATYRSYPDIGTVDALVRASDEALYEAKERGRNRVVRYHPRTPASRA